MSEEITLAKNETPESGLPLAHALIISLRTQLSQALRERDRVQGEAERSSELYAEVCVDRDAALRSTAELRGALERLALAAVHRPAYGIGTVHVGWRCKLCEVDNLDPAKIEHKPSCALASSSTKET